MLLVVWRWWSKFQLWRSSLPPFCPESWSSQEEPFGRTNLWILLVIPFYKQKKEHSALKRMVFHCFSAITYMFSATLCVCVCVFWSIGDLVYVVQSILIDICNLCCAFSTCHLYLDVWLIERSIFKGIYMFWYLIDHEKYMQAMPFR